MRKVLFVFMIMGLRLSLAAQFDGDTALRQAFTTYMQQRMAPEQFQLDRLDTVQVFKGDLDYDGIDDAAIQWRQGQEQRIVAFSKKDDGYKMSAEADCVCRRPKTMVFDITKIDNIGRLSGSIKVEYHDQKAKAHMISIPYWLRLVDGELLGQHAASLTRNAAKGGHLRDIRPLLLLSWPIHHLGQSIIFWEYNYFESTKWVSFENGRHRYLGIRDPHGSETEDTTTLTSIIYPAKKGRQLIVITWQEGTNTEWDSQDHWAAFWDHGKWIPAMDSVFPPLDGRIFFDAVPDNQDLLHEGWQVALHIDRYTDEIIAAPANKLEIIQAVYPDLVAQMQAPQVRYVWNRRHERFEVRPPR